MGHTNRGKKPTKHITLLTRKSNPTFLFHSIVSSHRRSHSWSIKGCCWWQQSHPRKRNGVNDETRIKSKHVFVQEAFAFNDGVSRVFFFFGTVGFRDPDRIYIRFIWEREYRICDAKLSYSKRSFDMFKYGKPHFCRQCHRLRSAMVLVVMTPGKVRRSRP